MLLDVSPAFFVAALMVLLGITHTARVFLDQAIARAQQRRLTSGGDSEGEEGELCARSF